MFRNTHKLSQPTTQLHLRIFSKILPLSFSLTLYWCNSLTLLLLLCFASDAEASICRCRKLLVLSCSYNVNLWCSCVNNWCTVFLLLAMLSNLVLTQFEITTICYYSYSMLVNQIGWENISVHLLWLDNTHYSPTRLARKLSREYIKISLKFEQLISITA